MENNNEAIKVQMFNGRTDSRLLKVNYTGLPIAMNQPINITNEDQIDITRVDDKSITMEITRRLIVNPKSLFEIEVTCFLRRSIGDNLNVPSLKTLDIKEYVSQHKNELTNVAFLNLSFAISNLTASFGGTPMVTPPAPTNNAIINVR